MDSDDEFDLEKIRAKNVSQIQDMFGDAFAEAQKIVNDVKNDLDFLSPSKPIKIKNRKKGHDSLFRFTGSIPVERRTSSRLSKSNPKYSFDDLDKIIGVDEDVKDKDYYYDDMDDLEDIIREPSKKRKIFSNRSSLPPVVRSPEEYTEAELNKIATRSSNKTYSQIGTSCHQCRQKTIDTKTVCRSGRCIGVRGQFCGPCLKNRYGENARTALLNPKWACPPCRNLCNCSICRNKQGKRPTGILAPIIQREGYGSVKDFLLNLAEKGILKKTNRSSLSSEEDNCSEENDPIEEESNLEVIDILIKSYIEKLSEKQMNYEFPKQEDENLSDIVGFNGRFPIYDGSGKYDADILGFTNSGKHCLIIDKDVLYQSLVSEYIKDD